MRHHLIRFPNRPFGRMLKPSWGFSLKKLQAHPVHIPPKIEAPNHSQSLGRQQDTTPKFPTLKKCSRGAHLLASQWRRSQRSAPARLRSRDRTQRPRRRRRLRRPLLGDFELSIVPAGRSQEGALLFLFYSPGHPSCSKGGGVATSIFKWEAPTVAGGGVYEFLGFIKGQLELHI